MPRRFLRVPEQSETGHETSDASPLGVALAAGGLAVAILIILAALAGLFGHFRENRPSADVPSRIATPHPIAPEPRLQVYPTAEFDQFRAAEEKKLNSYGWIDKGQNIIRIPVTRAMDLIAQRGLPVRSGPDDRRTSGITAIQMQEQKAAATRPKQ